MAAAREAFTEADRSASLEDIARRAGVGIGTLYRHFPTRADLVQAVYVDEVEALSRSAGELAELEPWEALTALAAALRRLRRHEAGAGRRALRGRGPPSARRSSPAAAPCSTPPASRCCDRAQEAGIVRPDVTIDEVVRLVGGIAKIPADDPADIQRVLAVALDGLRYRAE